MTYRLTDSNLLALIGLACERAEEATKHLGKGLQTAYHDWQTSISQQASGSYGTSDEYIERQRQKYLKLRRELRAHPASRKCDATIDYLIARSNRSSTPNEE
jgi:hypothetical protein